MRWKISKPARVALWLLEGLLLVVLAALLVTSTSWFERLVEQRIVSGLENLTGGRVELSGFRLRPLLFQVAVNNLIIHGSESAGEPPLITAHDFEVTVFPDQLLRRRLRFRSVAVDRLDIHLRTNANGSTNLPGPSGRVAPALGLPDLLDLSVGHVNISHSSFSWNDQRYPFELDGREFAVLLRMAGHQYAGTLSSSGTMIHLPRWNAPPVSLTARFEIARTGLTVPFISWRTEGMSGGGSFTFRLPPAPEAYASFEVAADLATISRSFQIRELRSGSVQAHGQAIYRNGDLFAQGITHVRGATFLLAGVASPELDATTEFSLQKGKLNLPDLNVTAWGGTAQAKLQADLATVPISFRLATQFHGLHLDSILRSVSPSSLLSVKMPLASIVDGTATTRGTGLMQRSETSFDAHLQGAAGTVRHALSVAGTARGTFNTNRSWVLHLASCDLRTAHSTLSAQGAVTEGGPDANSSQSLNFRAQTTNFDEWRPLVEELLGTAEPIPVTLVSPAEFSGTLGGSYSDPSLEGRLRMGQFEYRGWTWDRMSAAVVARSGFAQISSGQLVRADSSLELSAAAQLSRWHVTPGSHVRLSARAQGTPLDGLKAAINSDFPLHGLATGHLDVEGAASELAGNGTLQIEKGIVGDEPFDSLDAQIQVAQSQWKFQSVRLAKGQGKITGELSVDPARRFVTGQFEGTGFRLAEIKHFVPAGPQASTNSPFDGDLSFQLHGQGTPESFQLGGAWRVANVSTAGTPLGDFTGVIEGKQQHLRIEGDNHGPAGTFHLVAQTTAADDWPLEAEGQFSDVRVDPWIRAFFNRTFAATVITKGSIRAAGPLRSPTQINLGAQVRELAVSYPNLEWKNEQPIDVRYEASTLTFSRFVMHGPSTELAVEGAVHQTDKLSLAVSAEGRADATLLSILDPKLEATGRSELHLRLTGTPTRPLLNGTLDVRDVSLTYGGLPFRFSNLEGNVQLEGERVVIRSLQGVSGGGRVNITGSLGLQESPRYDFQAVFNQVRVRYPPNFTSTLDGNLRLSGDPMRGQLRGEWNVRQMAVNQNANFIAQMIQSNSPFAELPEGVTSPLASRIRVNVRVTSPSPIHLETPDVRLVADVDTRLEGTLADPVQVGSIHLLSGEGVFRGNRYTLTRGDISMTNPFHTQVGLDLEAQTRVQNYRLTLVITGPFDRLRMSYRSDPPLPTGDIISLLALGYVKQENTLTQTGTNPTASVGASAILSEALSAQVTGRIQHLFGVSRIKIDPNVGLPGYGSGARVTVEQQVGRDLTLTYITDTAASQYRIIEFQWNVNENVSILGVRDPNGIFGVEFRFRQRFK